jgi:hypothetical protein
MTGLIIVLTVLGLAANVRGLVLAFRAINEETRARGLRPQWLMVLDRIRAWLNRVVLRRPTPRHIVINVNDSAGASDSASVEITASGVVGTGDPVEDRFRLIEADLKTIRADLHDHRLITENRLVATDQRIDAGLSKIEQRLTLDAAEDTEISERTVDIEMRGLGWVALGTALSGMAGVLALL